LFATGKFYLYLLSLALALFFVFHFFSFSFFEVLTVLFLKARLSTKVNRSGSAKKWHSCLERQEATEPFSSSRHFQKNLEMPRRGCKGILPEPLAQPKTLLGDLRSEYFCAGDGAWKSSLIRWPILPGLCLLVSHP
jgi:hypothetical protein